MRLVFITLSLVPLFLPISSIAFVWNDVWRTLGDIFSINSLTSSKEQPIQVGVGTNADKSKYGLLWGTPDSKAFVGHLFKKTIPSNALIGDLSQYVIKAVQAGDTDLPKWMYYNSSSHTFYGLPFPSDQGIVYIELLAHPIVRDEETYTLSFLIRTIMPRRKFISENPNQISDDIGIVDDNQHKFYVCAFDENANYATLVLNVDIGLRATERVKTVYKTAQFLRHRVMEINFMPRRNDVVTRLLDQEVIVAGPGDATFATTQSGVELSWLVGCGDFNQREDVAKVMEHNIKNGLIYNELGFRVIGWYVSRIMPPENVRKVRIRRQAAATATPTMYSSLPTKISDIATETMSSYYQDLSSAVSAPSLTVSSGLESLTTSSLSPVDPPSSTQFTSTISTLPVSSVVTSLSESMGTALPSHTQGGSTVTTQWLSSLAGPESSDGSIKPTSTGILYASSMSSSVPITPTTVLIEPSATMPSSQVIDQSSDFDSISFPYSSMTSVYTTDTSSVYLDSSMSIVDTFTVPAASSIGPTPTLKTTYVLESSLDISSIEISDITTSLMFPASSIEPTPTTSISELLSDSSLSSNVETLFPDTSSMISSRELLVTDISSLLPSIFDSPVVIHSSPVSSPPAMSTVISSIPIDTSYFVNTSSVPSLSFLSPVESTSLLETSPILNTPHSSMVLEVFTTILPTTLILESSTVHIAPSETTISLFSVSTPPLPTTSLENTTSLSMSSIIDYPSSVITTITSGLHSPLLSSTLFSSLLQTEVSFNSSILYSPIDTPFTVFPTTIILSSTIQWLEYSSGQVINVETFSHPPPLESSAVYTSIPRVSSSLLTSYSSELASSLPTDRTESILPSSSMMLSVEPTSSSSQPQSPSSSAYITSSLTTPVTSAVTTPHITTLPAKPTTDSMTSKPLTTDRFPTTDFNRLFTTEMPKTAPILVNQIEKISTKLGTYFEYDVPEDTFFDKEDGNTGSLNLTLYHGDGADIIPSSWVQFDRSKQKIYGLPLEKDLTALPAEFYLVAQDTGGLKARDAFQIIISEAGITDISYEFIIQLQQDFTAFMLATQNYVDVVNKFGAFYQDEDPTLVTISDVRSGSVVMAVTNNTVSLATCDNNTIIELYRRINSNGVVNPDFVKSMLPWSVTSTDVVWRGVCLPVPVNVTEAPTLVPAIAGGSSDTGMIVGVVLVIIVLIVILLLIFFLWRRRRGQKGAYLPEDEKPIFGKNRKPVLLEAELELHDKSTRPKRPVVLPKDHDPYTYANEGYSPGGDAPDRSNPPPYVMPLDGGYPPNLDIADSPASPPDYLLSPSAASSPLDSHPPPEYKLPPPYMMQR